MLPLVEQTRFKSLPTLGGKRVKLNSWWNKLQVSPISFLIVSIQIIRLLGAMELSCRHRASDKPCWQMLDQVNGCWPGMGSYLRVAFESQMMFILMQEHFCARTTLIYHP